MQLSQLRERVRLQTETTQAELSNTAIDWYLQEAFNRIIAMENEWPFFEKSWDLIVTAGETSVELPGDVNIPAVYSLRDVSTGRQLEMIDNVTAEKWFGSVDPASVYPVYYSIWSGSIYLWPRLSYGTDRDYSLNGFRLPGDWQAEGPEGEPDCDERLHRPMIHYACSLAYAAQEDLELEDKYMRRWQTDNNSIIPSIMEPHHNRPLRVGPHVSTRIGPGPRGPSYVLVPPS